MGLGCEAKESVTAESLSLDDGPALDAACADKLAADGSFEDDLNTLKIGQESAQGFSRDFGPGPAVKLSGTASDVFVTGNGTFAANDAGFHKRASFQILRVTIYWI